MGNFIDPTAKISPFCDIEISVRGTRFVVGKNTRIDSFVKIKPAGGVGDIVIGDDCTVNSGCVFYSGNGILIGDSVAIAANCCFAPVNHEFRNASKLIIESGFTASRGGIVVEDDVWIGAGCVILDGAILRKGCVVGAMSLVRGEISAYSINVGSPIRKIGSRK